MYIIVYKGYKRWHIWCNNKGDQTYKVRADALAEIDRIDKNPKMQDANPKIVKVN